MRRWIASLSLLFLASCVIASVHPFVEKEDAIVRKELFGVWELIQEGEKDEKEELRLLFEPKEADDPTYRIEFEEKGESSVYEALLFELDGDLFLNFRGSATDSPGPYFLPVHGLFRVELAGNFLSLAPLNFEYFEQKMKENQGRVPGLDITKTKQGALLLTSSTEQLQAYLKMHKGDKNFFGEEGRFKRVDD